MSLAIWLMSGLVAFVMVATGLLKLASVEVSPDMG